MSRITGGLDPRARRRGRPGATGRISRVPRRRRRRSSPPEHPGEVRRDGAITPGRSRTARGRGDDHVVHGRVAPPWAAPGSGGSSDQPPGGPPTRDGVPIPVARRRDRQPRVPAASRTRRATSPTGARGRSGYRTGLVGSARPADAANRLKCGREGIGRRPPVDPRDHAAGTGTLGPPKTPGKKETARRGSHRKAPGARKRSGGLVRVKIPRATSSGVPPAVPVDRQEVAGRHG